MRRKKGVGRRTLRSRHSSRARPRSPAAPSPPRRSPAPPFLVRRALRARAGGSAPALPPSLPRGARVAGSPFYRTCHRDISRSARHGGRRRRGRRLAPARRAAGRDLHVGGAAPHLCTGVECELGWNGGMGRIGAAGGRARRVDSGIPSPPLFFAPEPPRQTVPPRGRLLHRRLRQPHRHRDPGRRRGRLGGRAAVGRRTPAPRDARRVQPRQVARGAGFARVVG